VESDAFGAKNVLIEFGTVLKVHVSRKYKLNKVDLSRDRNSFIRGANEDYIVKQG
jgi:hypothetical protein